MIYLNQSSIDVIFADAVQIFPDECCGFIYGIDTNPETRNITVAKTVINNKTGDKRRRFEISPLDYMKAERFAEENNLQLLGVFHSHPNHPAIPSATDLEKALPFFSYIIVSVIEGVVANTTSWLLNSAENKFEEEVIVIV